MSVSRTPVLDLSDKSLSQLSTFGKRAESLTVSQLIVALARLEATRARAAAAQERAGEVEGLTPEFLVSLAETETQVAAMLAVIAGELDGRLCTTSKRA